MIYTEAPFRRTEADRVAAGVRSGALRPDKDGMIILVPGGVAYYVTPLPGGRFMLLLPSYRDHETDSLSAYVFAPPLFGRVGATIRVVGPVRATLHGPRSHWIRLTLDERLTPEWYHGHGTW